MSKKLQWQQPNYAALSQTIVKSGRNYFPNLEENSNAIAVNSMNNAGICANIGNAALNFTPNAAAICNGTATANAGPGVGGFQYTAGPINTANCGNVGTINTSYAYDTWSDDINGPNVDFNFDISVNFCSQ